MSMEVRSPMQGVILEIKVKEGDKVAEDDELLILEAMKMGKPDICPVKRNGKGD